MGFRHYDELWSAVKSVFEEIFKNPFQQWNYIHISFDSTNKIFSAIGTKNLENLARRDRVKLQNTREYVLDLLRQHYNN